MARSVKRKIAAATMNASGDAVSQSEGARVTEQDVARRAYDLYLARGCEHGHDVEDWLQAEHELNGSAAVV